MQVGQQVSLELDGSKIPVPCVVTSLEGPAATLVNMATLPEEVEGRLAGGATGFLVAGGATGVVGLRGAAILTPESRPLIEFVTTDERS